MSTYFGFSDERGLYEKDQSDTSIRSHPYYLRGTFLFDSKEWINLNQAGIDLKNKYDLPPEREIKWSYLWSLQKNLNNTRGIKKTDKYSFLESYDLKKLEKYYQEFFSLIPKSINPKIIFTITNNSYTNNHDVENILYWHLQEVIQRIEMEIQNNPNNICVLFMDEINSKQNKTLKELFHLLIVNGDFIKYKHIKDSLSCENSGHSIGIQIADFISGCVGALLRGHNQFLPQYKKYIHPFIRTDQSGNIMGYGIREVPRQESFRKELKQIFDDFYVN